MSFKQLLLDQVQNLMRIMANGEIAVDITYYSYTGLTYNPSTRTNTSTYATGQNIKGIFTKTDELEGIPTEKTAKLLIAAADLSTAPKEQDKVTGLSDTWLVDRIMDVPGKSIYILKVCRDTN